MVLLTLQEWFVRIGKKYINIYAIVFQQKMFMFQFNYRCIMKCFNANFKHFVCDRESENIGRAITNLRYWKTKTGGKIITVCSIKVYAQRKVKLWIRLMCTDKSHNAADIIIPLGYIHWDRQYKINSLFMSFLYKLSGLVVQDSLVYVITKKKYLFWSSFFKSIVPINSPKVILLLM